VSVLTVMSNVEAAGESGRREAAKVARRYRLRKIVGRQGTNHVLECGHRVPLPSGDFGPVEPPQQRRCHQCRNPTQVCKCSPGHDVHWKDEHRRNCASCGCKAFRPYRLDLT
jgi:hypothetical protein